MRLRNVKNKEEILKDSLLLIENPKQYKGKWKEVFQNSNPICVEIGMGKGDFILESALRFPEKNWIGIEKYDSIMARAVQKIEKSEVLPSNLRLVKLNATEITDIFDKEVTTIYLNFSDPWPKKRHAERRLTSETFLSKYDSVFAKENIIEMKTDNLNLFAFSLVTLSKHGYVFEEASLDLHQDQDNVIMSEYEKKFVEEKVKINYFRAKKPV